jgi:hypothetical protein
MPTLNRYTPDSDKDGYYILANVGGESPITLQVTWIASRVLEAVGYEDGDAVPTELVWTMYSLDMLYTITSVELDSGPPEVNPGEILDKLDLENELTQKERARVISYLEAYSGPDEERINELREKLIEEIPEDTLEAASRSSGTWFETRHQLPETTSEVASVLQEWTSSDLTERAEKALVLNEEFVTWSVRTFAAHPKLAEEPITRINNEEIAYELELPESENEVTVADCRGHSRTVDGHVSATEYDYRIRRTLFDGTREIGYIKGDLIVSYESHNGDRGSLTMMKYDLDEILPPHRSYFGDSGDKRHKSNYLQEEFFKYSSSEVRDRAHKPSDDTEESKIYDNLPKELADAIGELPDVGAYEVDGTSNNNNLKLDINGKLVVVTKDIRAETGDTIILRNTGEFRDNQIVNNAVRADTVPTDSPIEYLKSQI